MRYSRIGLWAAAATVAVAVTTTVVATATGAAGRDVLTEEGVADALAAVGPAGGTGARSAPVGADETAANSADETPAPGDEKLLRTSAGDIVASCEKDGLSIHSVAPKPGYRVLMVEIGKDGIGKALRWGAVVKPPAGEAVWTTVVKVGEFAFVFDKASSEVSIKVALRCVDGVPTAKESEIVKNYGAGKG
jgi:hypothetical protein